MGQWLATMKKFLTFFLSVFIVCYFLFIPVARAQVNVIENWDDETLSKISENFGPNAWVVVVGNPEDQNFVDVINNYSFKWVIRGYAHWLSIGKEMFDNPESAAQKWNQFFGKLNKKVYFQPWNEPTSINPECYGEPLESCAPKIVDFINALDTSKIILTTPSFDPHNQENTVTELIRLMKETIEKKQLDFNEFFSKFEAITINVYDPNLAKNYSQLLNNLQEPLSDLLNSGLLDQKTLSHLLNLPIIFTETGLLSYNAQDICQNMYCAGVVEQWQADPQVIGWAIFSNYQNWNLWDHPCVIEALKGDCHCQDCQTSGGGKALKAIIQEIYSRSPKPASWHEAKVSRNWFPGPSTPNNNPSFLQRLFQSLAKLFRLPRSLDWVPSDKEDRYPGEDPEINYTLTTKKIKFNGTVAEFCIPPNTITHRLKFFPFSRPSVFSQEIMNITSIHHWVFRGLDVFREMIKWYTGFTYDPDKPFIDVFSPSGPKQLLRRGITNLNAGFASKAIPGEMYDQLVNRWMSELLLAAATPEKDRSPQQRGLIALFDRPLLWFCEGKGILTESDFTRKMKDGRIDRTYAEGCTASPIPIKPSLLFCCNPDFFENNPIAQQYELEYERVCAHAVGSDGPTHWSCNAVKSMEGILFSFYYWAKLLVDGLVSHADLPAYIENCYPISQERCENNPNVKSGFFIDLSPEERYQVFPPANEEGRWRWPTPNSFTTRAEGKCWNCQLVKTYIPHLLGMIDACDKMTKMNLPEDLNQELTKSPSQKVSIPCNIGKVPGADGKEVTAKANEDYINPTSISSHDQRGTLFFSFHQVSTCPITYDENGMPHRCEEKLEVKSRTRLYLGHYDKIRNCLNSLYGLLGGETIEALEKEIRKQNGNKIDPKDLPVEAIANGIGVDSGLRNCDRTSQWQEDPNSFCDQSYGQSQNKIYYPGGAIEITKGIIDAQFMPGELQNK